jgi:hypothetical protein
MWIQTLLQLAALYEKPLILTEAFLQTTSLAVQGQAKNLRQVSIYDIMRQMKTMEDILGSLDPTFHKGLLTIKT